MHKSLVSARLGRETFDDLKVLAEKQDRTVSYLLRKAVEEFVGRHKGKKEKGQAY